MGVVGSGIWRLDQAEGAERGVHGRLFAVEGDRQSLDRRSRVLDAWPSGQS